MKLIADAGSSKTEWALVCGEGDFRTWESAGVNALICNDLELRTTFNEALKGVDEEIESTHFYGAGCTSDAVAQKIAEALSGYGRVEAMSDLWGAARGLLGRERGLVAILGTGSNCGSYDGERIVGHMAPMGYIIGDEGSGTALGKALLRKVYRGSESLRKDFELRTGADYSTVLERVYRMEGANRFLASLTPYIIELGMNEVATEVFDAFFAAARERFPEEREIALTGGVAYGFAKEIAHAAKRAGFTVKRIEQRPMSGLIKFHSHE